MRKVILLDNKGDDEDDNKAVDQKEGRCAEATSFIDNHHEDDEANDDEDDVVDQIEGREVCGGSWRSQSLLLRQELEWTRETEEEGKGFCTKREKDGRLDAHSS